MYYFYDTTKLIPPPFLKSHLGQVWLWKKPSSRFCQVAPARVLRVPVSHYLGLFPWFLIFNTNSQAQFLIAPQLSSWYFHVTPGYQLMQAPKPWSSHIYSCRLSTAHLQGLQLYRWQRERYLLSCSVHSLHNLTWQAWLPWVIYSCPESLLMIAWTFCRDKCYAEYGSSWAWEAST